MGVASLEGGPPSLKRRAVRLLSMAVLATVGTVAFAASTASASTTSTQGQQTPSSGSVGVLAAIGCNVVTSHCETAAIPANSSGHWIKYGVDSASISGCSWAVRDVNTWVVVRSGRLGSFSSTSGEIPGLYGWYRLELWNCGFGAHGKIWNAG
jgi:hypothetical protein